jgi:hypothetical protein
MALSPQDRKREDLVRRHERIAAPIVADLKEAGFPVHSVDQLPMMGQPYPEAVPILLHWLPRIDDPFTKESIVRALSVPWAKRIATRPLLEEFVRARKEDHMLRWAIGNAVEVIADKSVAEDLQRIVSDPSNGTARRMFVLPL